MATVIISIDGCGNVVAKERTFKSGSKGFYGCGKVVAKNGKRYQFNGNLVEIGSKPGGKTKNDILP